MKEVNNSDGVSAPVPKVEGEKKEVKKGRLLYPYGKVTLADRKRSIPYYEMVVMVRSDIVSQDYIAMVKKIIAKIADYNGKMVGLEYWGCRDLAYKIKKSKKAHYQLFQFEGDGALCLELDRVLKNSNSVIRHLILRVRAHAKQKSLMLVNLDKDIANGSTVYDERYIVRF